MKALHHGAMALWAILLFPTQPSRAQASPGENPSGRVRWVQLSCDRITDANCDKESKFKVSPDFKDVDMIFWEGQKWSGFPSSCPCTSRLTLWADGRSEIIVGQVIREGNPRVPYPPNPGWTIAQKGSCGAFYRKENPYSKKEAAEKFVQALSAITRLKPPENIYMDGGSVVGIRTKGKIAETVNPVFPDETVEKLLKDFDRSDAWMPRP